MQAAGGNADILKDISEFAPPSPADVCLGLRHRLAAISWLAINQTVNDQSPHPSPSNITPNNIAAARRVRYPTAAETVMASGGIRQSYIGSAPHDRQDR